MNYLIADYTGNKFQMAPAIQMDSSNQGVGYQLEAICDPAMSTSTTTFSTLRGTAIRHWYCHRNSSHRIQEQWYRSHRRWRRWRHLRPCPDRMSTRNTALSKPEA